MLCLQENRHYEQKTKDNPAKVLVMSKALVLPNITMEDKGVYHCKAEIAPTKHKNATAKVLVYGEHVLDGFKISLQKWTNMSS